VAPEVSPTREFAVHGLRLGQARIGVGLATSGLAVAAIWVSDQDIAGRELELRPGEKLTDVRILITNDQDSDTR